MNKKLNAKELVKMSDEIGFVQTVYSVFGKTVSVNKHLFTLIESSRKIAFCSPFMRFLRHIQSK